MLLIGLPGSGKSYWAAQLRQQYPGAIVISTDAIRGQLFGDESIQGAWQPIWQEVGRQFRQAVLQIQQGAATVAAYDATNVRRKQRKQVLALARSSGFTHITAVVLDTPLSLCLERNRLRQQQRQVPEPVIHRMHRQLVGAPPSLAEGIDRLMMLSPAGASPPAPIQPSTQPKQTSTEPG